MIKRKKEYPMLNEFLFEIIIGIVAVCSIAVYFIVKRSVGSQASAIRPEKREIPSAAAELKTEPVQAPQEATAVITAEPPAPAAKKRKSDTLVPKRSVPELGQITKHHFSEFSGERILVAEDNLINQKVILGLLAESGIEVVVANDGKEALDILERDADFLMILMDAHMPRVDGFEATRIIRANPRYDHILVVALSGDTAPDDIQKMKDAGMGEQLAKPLRMDALYAIIYAYADKEIRKKEVVQTAAPTQNLDVSKGLETCGGDENFYREIVSEFLLNYGDSSDRLGQFLRTGYLQGADRLLLDIIGISETIGARPLHEIATNLKLSLSDTEERSYFTFFDHYRVGLERLLREVRAYL